MLPLRARFRMAWEMTWPLAAIDLGVILIIHGVLEARDETLDSIWAVVGFFVVSPWVVRRGLARAYDDTRTVVVSKGEDRPRLTYQQSLKVMWLLAWRSTVLALAALLVFSALLKVVGIRPRDLPLKARS